MNFKTLLGSERKYNFHSHTEFCDGRAQMRAFAAEAVAMGMKYYGFSPHSPIPIESPCNMNIHKVKDYLEEVARLREKYADSGIQFFASMEIDFLGDTWGPSKEYFQNLELDYRIGSIHFIPAQDGTLIDIDGSFERFQKNMSSHFRNDLQYVVETFFDQTEKMIEYGGFDIIGHFDKIAHNAAIYDEKIEDSPRYNDRIDRIIDAIAKKGLTAEINTKAYRDKKRFFPANRYWKKILDAGIPIVVNSDAHVPALINASRDQAFDILDNISAGNEK